MIKITPELLQGRRFKFGRVDGTTICPMLYFRPGGSIGGFWSKNERSWLIRDDKLHLCDETGGSTSIFGDIQLREGYYDLTGAFIKSSPDRPWHTLTEIPRAVAKPVSFARSTGIPRHSASSNSVAVLLRSHIVDEKFREIHRKLSSAAPDYDLYSAVDETRAPLDTPAGPKLTHSATTCADLGLSQQHPALLWQCGDFPFYFALCDLPYYEHYIMIEYDVHLTRHDGDFISRLVRKLKATPGAVDMVGLGMARSGPNWEWFESCAKIYGDVWGMYYPFVCLSRRAVAYMFGQRQIEAVRQPNVEDIMHCEAFTASSLQAAGFHCHDLNDLMPGSYIRRHMSLKLGAFIGQELGLPETLELVHPVYTPETYLSRIFGDVNARKMSVGDFVALLGSESAQGLPRDLKENYLQRAHKLAETHH